MADEIKDSREDELVGWWMDLASKEIQATIPKALEYGGNQQGSADLEVMGAAMQFMISPEKASEMSPEERRRFGMEMAVAFYALGKVARLYGAYSRGDRPSDDTWFDLGVYCRMAERVREVGQWP